MHEQMNLDAKAVNKSKWHITDEQFELINVINLNSRLYFSLQLKFYEHYHTFFESFADIPKNAINLICKQLKLPFKLSKRLF